ncbi:MAG: 50S ribosomal protein L2 [Saprospiraceae bacterium]|jgi:large subunit ribosomal protein L2|nr:50S ribosomal protein L2 [Saprospiraceae bacterium]
MAVKTYNPITPGQRFKTSNSFADLTPGATPEKSLTTGLTKSGGRNNQGRRSMRYIGGGHKQLYRIVDFKRNHDGVPATVKSIEYDPNRSAFIALLWYADGTKSYIIAPKGLKAGAQVMSGEGAAPEVGNTLFLKEIPLGTEIHCIEMEPGAGANMARGAGSYGMITGREGKYATVKMPSGEVRRILLTCRATMGVVSNSDHNLIKLGKAGRNRWLGRTPRVRGVVMNPVDHPMGGGEGRASGGHPRSRNGQIAKGLKTRDTNKRSSRLIVSRRNSKG